MKMYLLLLFFIYSCLSFAGTHCESLGKRLTPLLEDSAYRPYFCETNAFRISQKLLLVDLPMGSEVVALWKYIDDPVSSSKSPQEIWQAFTPAKPRQKNASWAYHVFVVVDGLVLDQDFEEQPRVVPLAQYLNEMYQDIEGSYWIASWPIEEYTTALVGRYSPRSGVDRMWRSVDFLDHQLRTKNCAE